MKTTENSGSVVWQDGDLRVHADGAVFVLIHGQWLREDEKTCVRLALGLSKCDGAARAAVAAVETLINRLNAVTADNAALLAEMKEAHNNHESISGAVFDRPHPGFALLEELRMLRGQREVTRDAALDERIAGAVRSLKPKGTT